MRYPYGTRVAGFTLIELLVVVSIIAMLIGLLMPVLGSARRSAKAVVAQSGLRQMLLGYSVYQHDYRGHVLYGYTPPTVDGVPVTVRLSSGHVLGLPVADRYPWRLAPYVNHVWSILHSHHDVPEMPAASDSDAEAMSKAYALSLSPAFGLNSIYVGGHGEGPYRGFVTEGGVTRANTGAHVVFHQSEVRRPSDLLVFTETKARGGPFADPDTGLYLSSPPRANGHRWSASAGGFEILMPGHITGLPEGRYGPSTITGFFDGHVRADGSESLNDMRRWANTALVESSDPVAESLK